MSNNTIIKISRGKYIEDSLDVAIIRLDSIYHRKGVLCMINYYTSENHSTFDTVFASGVRDGVGRDCYRIISLRQENIIWGVGSTLPDVSQLIHGEKYLYQDPQGKWWLVQIASDGRTRELVELSDSLVTYTMLSDGSKWISDGRGGSPKVYQEGDTYSRAEIDAFIEDAKSTVRYVDFDTLTPSQIEELKGPKGDKGDEGKRGIAGIQGEQGIRGYNGSIDNFVVLSQNDYDRLTYIDPYKFYFTYEDEEPPVDQFYAYVTDNVLNIYATVYDNTLNLDTTHSSLNGNTLEIQSTSSLLPTPYFDPIEGTYDGNIVVSILCSDPDSIIRYTIDRSLPDQNSTIYNGPLSLDSSTTIKAIATKHGFKNSAIAEATYNLIFQETVSDPVIDHDSGTYEDPFYVNVSCLTSEAVIRYTLDGTEPNETSKIYLSPLFIGESDTALRVRAFKSSMNPSNTVSRIYRVNNSQSVSAPIISPEGGTYNIDQTISITCMTQGAIIRYTLDGTDPTQESYIYTEPLLISESTIVKAKAFKQGLEPSETVIESYIIDKSPTGDPIVEDDTLKNLDNADMLGTTLYLSSPSVYVNYNTLIFS